MCFPRATYKAGAAPTRYGSVVIPPIGLECGNGLWEMGELCDDGNRINGDCCNEFCKVEADCRCPEPPEVGACGMLSFCGDGLVTPAESCDDGNTADFNGCSSDCKTVTPGWQCRAPGKDCAPLCGDGQILGAEECDDGGRLGGDGCSSRCITEPGWSCIGEPSCTQSVCGNGVVEPYESCDLGEENGEYDGDGGGCSLTCTDEPTCVNDACTTFCGDGNVDIGADEQCDDGNQFSGDGCTVACAIEAGYTCENRERPDLTIGTQCLPRCGDEVVTVSEECDDGDAETDADGVFNEDSAYGGCDTQCRPGPYCGDGVVFDGIDPRSGRPYEACDEGVENTAAYGVLDGCSPSCQLTPFCGDGIIDSQFGETCDEGPLNGENGRCGSFCTNVG